jgi:hypothetical protein
MIHMPLKWRRIDECNKNCKKIDVLTLIFLVRLNSFTLNMNVIYNGWK